MSLAVTYEQQVRTMARLAYSLDRDHPYTPVIVDRLRHAGYDALPTAAGVYVDTKLINWEHFRDWCANI